MILENAPERFETEINQVVRLDIIQPTQLSPE